MSIFSPRNNSTSKLQSELARLEKKRASLAGRLVAAESAAAAAQEARRRHLIESDDIDASEGVKFSEAVDAAQRDVTAIYGAISELEAMIAEGRQAVVAAKESAARAKRASEIQERIKKLEPLCAEAEKTFEKLAATLERIAETADDDALALQEYHELRGHGSTLPVTSIIGAALAQAIFRDMPDLLTAEKSFGASFARVGLHMMIERYDGLSRDIPIDHGDENSFEPKPLSGGLQSTIIAPLKQAASEILTGERPLATARPIDDDDDEDTEPAFEHRRIILTKSIRWIDWNGEPRQHPDGDADIPAPVAIAAKAAGIAFDHGTREGDYHLDRRIEHGFHNSAQPMNADVVDLRVTWPATTRAAA